MEKKTHELGFPLTLFQTCVYVCVRARARARVCVCVTTIPLE